MDMNTATLPRKGLKKYDYNIDMEKKDLKKLTEGQLIKLLLKKEKKPKVVIADDTKPVPTPRTYKSRPPVPTPRKSVNDMVQFFENKPTPPPRTGKWENVKPKPVPRKPSRDPPLPPTPKHEFNFDDDIFQTENQNLEKFKIISVQSRQNKKFKSYTNEFKVKILKKLDDVKEVYYIFQELVKTVKKRRNLSDNDMLRLVIQNEELPNAISTKFNKVENFKLGDLENVINILEYRAIPIEKCKIVVQSVEIPTGKGRLYLTKDTVSRKGCIITVKNDDTTCLARSIVTAMANLHPEKWTKTQIHDGFNKSRKLQKEEAMKFMAHSRGLSLASIRPSLHHAVKAVIAINYIALDHFSISYY